MEQPSGSSLLVNSVYEVSLSPRPGRRYRDLADALVQATPVWKPSLMAITAMAGMADDAELRRNRLNLLGVLRTRASLASLI